MNFKKKSQTWSLETYIAVGVFLVAIIFFYALITIKSPSAQMDEQSGIVTKNILQTDMFSDSKVDFFEARQMARWNCSQIKELFATNKNVCIYFTDRDGNIIPLNTTKIAVGCPGINVSGVPCSQE